MPLPRQDFHLSLKPLGMSGRDDCVVAAPDHQAWLLPDNIAQIQALPPALEQLGIELAQRLIHAFEALELEHVLQHLPRDQRRVAEQLNQVRLERVAVSRVGEAVQVVRVDLFAEPGAGDQGQRGDPRGGLARHGQADQATH